MKLHGLNYHYLGVLMPPQGLFKIFLSVYFQDTDLSTQTKVSVEAISQFDDNFMKDFTAMLHGVNSSARSLQRIID